MLTNADLAHLQAWPASLASMQVIAKIPASREQPGLLHPLEDCGRDCDGLIELGEMARTTDHGDFGRGLDQAGEPPCVARRHDAVLLAVLVP